MDGIVHAATTVAFLLSEMTKGSLTCQCSQVELGCPSSESYLELLFWQTGVLVLRP